MNAELEARAGLKGASLLWVRPGSKFSSASAGISARTSSMKRPDGIAALNPKLISDEVQPEAQCAAVRIEVGDNGMGMSEEFVREKLFRPFSSTKKSGMGLGSYESFQYIRELGGSIDVDSVSGRGTVFTLVLPLFEAHSSSQLQAAAQP